MTQNQELDSCQKNSGKIISLPPNAIVWYCYAWSYNKLRIQRVLHVNEVQTAGYLEESVKVWFEWNASIHRSAKRYLPK